MNIESYNVIVVITITIPLPVINHITTTKSGYCYCLKLLTLLSNYSVTQVVITVTLLTYYHKTTVLLPIWHAFAVSIVRYYHVWSHAIMSHCSSKSSLRPWWCNLHGMMHSSGTQGFLKAMV